MAQAPAGRLPPVLTACAQRSTRCFIAPPPPLLVSTNEPLLQPPVSAKPAALHVYERELSPDAGDSLSAVASLVEAGQTVLDLGMGTGALGRYLVKEKDAVVDGLTLNPEEAERARGSYRQVAVADLDAVELCRIFAGCRYDRVVCADVLEHLKHPERLLAQLPDLLSAEGKLIISVPNAAYAGLVAELMAGEFEYRPEGLLDATHLRFFTRSSLSRWLDEHGWQPAEWMRVHRTLSESEFAVRLDALPPAVASYLQARPDAGVYQYVLTAKPSTATATHPPDQRTPASTPVADFIAQLYWADGRGFDESHKVVARGWIGQEDQTLRFALPPHALNDLCALKLDPADRTGFVRLLHMELRDAAGAVHWRWDGSDPQQVGQALNWHSHDVLWRAAGPLMAGLQGMVYGPDPAIDLPLSAESLSRLQGGGAELSLRIGWPMSSDYVVLAPVVQDLRADLQRQRVTSQQMELVHEQLQHERQLLLTQLTRIEADRTTLQGDFERLQRHVQTVEGTLGYRLTRPLARLKNGLVGMLRPVSTPSRALHAPSQRIHRHRRSAPAAMPVDIIVPVYRGLADTQACLQALAACPYKMPVRLVIINDASPEPDLVQWLTDFARQTHAIPVELLHNEQNRGFVGTVNRGMALHPEADVVLFNSDAVAVHDWLDRLQAAAYSDDAIATATPFSNNATICSYPRFCQVNPLPASESLASLDALCAQHLASLTVDIPTAHGFCMYIRRAALAQVGLFDEAHFGKGYGEENDFCVRASHSGWRHVHALDVFVQHAGGVSFGAQKKAHEDRAMDTLRRLHPQYEAAVHRFIEQDPAAWARRVLDFARLQRSDRPVVLNVTHNREGGTLRHQHELAETLGERAVFLMLTPCPEGVALGLCGPAEELQLRFALPSQDGDLLHWLRALRVAHVHFHHLLDHTDAVLALPKRLQVSHDFTAHDYFSYCPQISLTDRQDRYCGERGLEQCRACVADRPAPRGLSIEQWHERHRPLLEDAQRVFCPTEGVATRLRRFAPQARLQVQPHTDLDGQAVPLPQLPTPLDQRPLRVVVVGALSRMKGADVLEQVAQLAWAQRLPLEFHLLGYAYRTLKSAPIPNLTVHGPYEEEQLPGLLQRLSADLAWFPALWPETYSYTLSACLQAGLPLVASDLGAFADRLHNRPLTWLHPWNSTTQQWATHLVQARAVLMQADSAPATRPQPTTALARWHYQSDYLTVVSSPAEVTDGHAAVATDLANKAMADGLMAPVALAGVRQLALRALLRLRHASVLSPLARRVPTHWQRRIKSWLISSADR